MSDTGLELTSLIEINPPQAEINPSQPAVNEATPVTIKRYQCRHIFTDGHRCASPAMRREHFCYYHHAHRKPVLARHRYKVHPDRGLKNLDDLEDRAAVQLTIAEVLRRIVINDIDPKRAGLVLYGLQIAQRNLPKSTPAVEPSPACDIIEDPNLGHIAALEEGRPDPDDEPFFDPHLTAEQRLDQTAAGIRRAAALHPLSQIGENEEEMEDPIPDIILNIPPL